MFFLRNKWVSINIKIKINDFNIYFWGSVQLLYSELRNHCYVWIDSESIKWDSHHNNKYIKEFYFSLRIKNLLPNVSLFFLQIYFYFIVYFFFSSFIKFFKQTPIYTFFIWVRSIIDIMHIHSTNYFVYSQRGNCN